MRIAEVRIHEVVVPMRPGTVSSPGLERPLTAADPFSGRLLADFAQYPKWIVELVADSGLVGLGEPRRGDLLAPLQEQAALMVGKTLPELPPGNLPLPHGDAYESYLVYEAFEMAWLDLLGKHLGVPVHHLLGGKRTDRVPIDYWMGVCTVEDTAARARRGVELSFHGIKMKLRPGEDHGARVRAVREVAPWWQIVVDFNESLTHPAQAVAFARAVEPCGAVVLESPLPQHRLDWYVRLRQKIAQPVALHLTSQRELLAALRLDAADYYNLLGPLCPFTEWARMAQAAGCPTWRGTGLDLGVRDMSSVHAAAAAGCSLPSDIVGHLLREDDLLAAPMRLEDGALVVPDVPGLGVELDRAALERYRVAEHRCPA
ncbi:MAG: mandelate racemase/muconate lactonizing enzyme family protein [Candidatus Latescibacterota bacterium]